MAPLPFIPEPVDNERMTDPKDGAPGKPAPLSASRRGQDAQYARAEALLMAAIAVALGVFALPLEMPLFLRLVLATAAFLVVGSVFGRFPQLSAWLVDWIVRVGPFLLGLLSIAFLAALFAPSVHFSPGTRHALTIGAGMAALRPLNYLMYFAERPNRIRSPLHRVIPGYWIISAIFIVVEFGVGSALGVYLRDRPGGEEFTDSYTFCLMIGLASGCVFQQLLTFVDRVSPPVPVGTVS